MFRRGRVFLIIGCLAQLALAQTSGARLTLGERAFTASKIYSMLQFYFSGWKALPELDLDVAYRNYLERALATDDRRQFDLATMEFVARLHNGHTLFSDSWLTQNYGQPMGFYARPLDGKWVVEISGLPSIKPGDVVAKVEDTDIEIYFRQQQKYIAGSSETAQRHNFFFLAYLFPQQFTLTLGNGRKISIDRSTSKLPVETRVNTEGRWLRQDTVGYIRIPSLANPVLEEKALAFVNQFQKAKALVIDVRNNAGGLSARRLTKALMDSTYRTWKESTPVHISLFEYFNEMNKGAQSKEIPDFERGYMSAFSELFDGSQLTWGGEQVPPEHPIFHGRIIFLVDGGCASACEELLEAFKDNHRGTLVGETTEGTAGPSYIHDFHNGMTIGIAVKCRYFPDGSEFEGIGIKPDVEIHPSVDDLRNGRDVVLDKALELPEK